MYIKYIFLKKCLKHSSHITNINIVLIITLLSKVTIPIKIWFVFFFANACASSHLSHLSAAMNS